MQILDGIELTVDTDSRCICRASECHCFAGRGSRSHDLRQFHSLAPMYYRNAAAAVVVYDITKAVCTLCTGAA